MADEFKYRIVEYDRQAPVKGETEAHAVERLLNSNAKMGWVLDSFADSGDGRFRWLVLKNRVSN